MLKYAAEALCLILLIGLVGCSSLDYVQGTKVTAEQVAAFTKGKTTKDEVVAALGGPQDIKFEGGKQVLIYKYQKIVGLSHRLTAGAANEGSSTTFIFNDKGVLEEILQSSGSSLPNPMTGT